MQHTSFALPAAVNPEFSLYHGKQKQFVNTTCVEVSLLYAACVPGCFEIS